MISVWLLLRLCEQFSSIIQFMLFEIIVQTMLVYVGLHSLEWMSSPIIAIERKSHRSLVNDLC